MDAALLDILCCPVTRQPLRLPTDDERTRLGADVLVVEDGSAAYPVRDDIPVLLPEERIPLL